MIRPLMLAGALAAFMFATLQAALPVMPHKEAVEMAGNEVSADLQLAAQYSRYKMPWFARPRVFILPDARFDAIFCGISGPACGIVGATESAGLHYIYVRYSETLNVQELRATLVHELVHWLQEHSGWGFHQHDCQDAVAHEVEAYSVEYVYELQGQGRHLNFWMPHFKCVDDSADDGEDWK